MHKLTCLLALAAPTVGCASLHAYDIGETDQSLPSRPIEIAVDETGISLQQASAAAGALSDNKAAGRAGTIAELLNYGPTTGNSVLDAKYADGVVAALYQQCPSGRITGVVSVRESRTYPILSGEIVKIKARCQD
ncbi:MAG: hypothetical protein IT374_16190 [Polyangiaceae bacterium]|nr:hypothetical protein [Polyangiaceae bacterium]